MKIGHFEIFATDPLSSKEFYERVLGFEVSAIQDGKIVWLRLGDTEVLLRPGMPQRPSDTYQNTSIAIVLYTDDLPTTMRTLEDRGLSFSGNDGAANCPTFKDPDGNWFQLVDPRDHV